MADIEPRQPVVHAADAYLDYHGHTQPAYERANQVLSKFEHMVKLATARALEELEVPCEREAIVIPFPLGGLSEVAYGRGLYTQ